MGCSSGERLQNLGISLPSLNIWDSLSQMEWQCLPHLFFWGLLGGSIHKDLNGEVAANGSSHTGDILYHTICFSHSTAFFQFLLHVLLLQDHRAFAELPPNFTSSLFFLSIPAPTSLSSLGNLSWPLNPLCHLMVLHNLQYFSKLASVHLNTIR